MERRKFVIGLGALASGAAAATGTGAFSAATMSGRDVNIAVSADDEALIQLVPGHYNDSGDGAESDGDSTVTDSRVFLEDGQLGISFDDEEGGDGVNPNSVFQLGAIGDDAAYYIDYLDADVSDPDRGTGFDLELLSSSDILYGEAANSDEPTSSADGGDPAFEVRNESDEEYEIEIAVTNPDEVPEREDAEALLLTDDTAPISGDVNRGLGVGLNPGDISESVFTLSSGDSVGFSLLLKVADVDPDDVRDWDTSLEFSVNEAI